MRIHPCSFKGGLLQHVPRALVDGARPDTDPADLFARPRPARAHPRIRSFGDEAAKDTNKLILGIITAELGALNSGLRALKEAQDPANAASLMEVSQEAIDQCVADFQVMRRDNETRQLATYVKNLEGFFDVMCNIVRVHNDFEVRYSSGVLIGRFRRVARARACCFRSFGRRMAKTFISLHQE
jgi:hypothetical protein